MTDTATNALPRMLGYQVIDVTTGEAMTYSQTQILTQQVATTTLFDLREATRSPDLYAMISIFEGDVEDDYGHKPKTNSFVPEFFTFTGSAGVREDPQDPQSPLAAIFDPDSPGDLALEMQVNPVQTYDMIAVLGLPMPPQSEAQQRSWPVLLVENAIKAAMETATKDKSLPGDDISSLCKMLRQCRDAGAEYLILDQAPGSTL